MFRPQGVRSLRRSPLNERSPFRPFGKQVPVETEQAREGRKPAGAWSALECRSCGPEGEERGSPSEARSRWPQGWSEEGLGRPRDVRGAVPARACAPATSSLPGHRPAARVADAGRSGGPEREREAR